MGRPPNVRFETEPDRFLDDLATCDAFVGTSGFQAICEAFYFGKKLVVQPIEGHYEQKWNAAQLELHGMGRWCRGDLEEALSQEFDRALHDQLRPWYESGAEQHYRAILRYASRTGAPGTATLAGVDKLAVDPHALDVRQCAMSKGCAEKTAMSASLPGSRLPTRSSIRRISAGVSVIARSASASSIPSLDGDGGVERKVPRRRSFVRLDRDLDAGARQGSGVARA